MSLFQVYNTTDTNHVRMAYAEMRMTMAKMIFNFDMELAEPDNDWWNKQGTYLVWEKMPLMVILRPRKY